MVKSDLEFINFPYNILEKNRVKIFIKVEDLPVDIDFFNLPQV